MENDAAPTVWVNRRVGVVTMPTRRILLDGSICNESTLGSRIINDKQLTRNFLQRASVPTADGRRADSAEHAVAIAQELGGSVVVKPGNAGRGKGVSVNLRTSEEVRKAYSWARTVNSTVVAEEYIDIAEEYRCIATPNECVSVVKRLLPNVTGTGHNTIRELIHRKNEERKCNPALRYRLIPIDYVLESTLQQQGLSLETVLEAGDTITVRNVGGLSSGGEPHEHSEIVSTAVKDVATRAIRAIPSLEWGGVDLAIETGTSHARVIEINASSDFGGATFPLDGIPRDVAGTAWRLRRCMGPDDPVGLAPRLPHIGTPQALRELLPNLWDGSEQKRFSDLFFSFLETSGYAVEKPNPRVVRVSGGDHAEKWFTSGATSGAELMAVGRALRKHGTVRRLLFLGKVRRTRGWPTASLAHVPERFGTTPYIAATPIDQAWRGRHCHIGEPGTLSASVKGATRWYVQSFPKGLRLRVLTRADTALAVLAPPETGPVQPSLVHKAVQTAVSAARAVPELHWASVDLVMPDHINGRPFLAEGLQSNPMLNRNDRLLAGSIEDLMDWLIRY